MSASETTESIYFFSMKHFCRPIFNFRVQGIENKMQGAGGPHKSVDEMFNYVASFKFEI